MKFFLVHSTHTDGTFFPTAPPVEDKKPDHFNDKHAYIKILVAIMLGVIIGFPLFLGGRGKEAEAAAPNLIANPDLEIVGADGWPQDWLRGRWGTNSTTFEYPVAGFDGTSGARVTMTSRTSGDAKWAFKPVAVTAGKTYEFSDVYIANVPTFLTLEFKLSDGTFAYRDVSQPPPASSFQTNTIQFSVPANVTELRVFHLLNQTGSLTVDHFSLKEVSVTPPPPPDPTNLISNPSLEVAAIQNNQPQDWARGRWGTNDATFIYPVTGFQSNRAARVEMASYTSGDAKWYPKSITATPGAFYEFSDSYRTNTADEVTAEVRLTSGALRYIVLGSPGQSSVWKTFTARFSVPSDAVSFTIFHVIAGVGFLEIDNASVKKLSTTDPSFFPEGMVTLTFDDGFKTTYDNAIPILTTAGLKSTQFIITGRFNFPGYVNGTQVIDMWNKGHEIGAHTRTHRDLTALSSSEATDEIVGSKNDLAALGITGVSSFAYPLGTYNDAVISIVKNAGFTAARSTDTGFVLRTADPYTLERQSVEVNTSVAQVKSWIDSAMTDHTWLVLVFHDISTSGTQYSTTPTNLQSIVNYLKQKDTKVVTLKEGRSLMP